MRGSRMILVRKRDGSEEAFEPLKLAGAIWRGMQQSFGRYRDARNLAEAVQLFLRRTGKEQVSSAALFEMVLKMLRRVGIAPAAEVLEVHRLWRTARREALLVCHGGGKITLWDKTWLVQHVRRAWRLSPTTARTIAGCIEMELLDSAELMVTRNQLVERMNACVAEFGLADAVPVRLSVGEV